MQVLKINDSKVKILLDRRDMERFGLLAKEVDLTDKAYRQSIFRVLSELEQRWGFVHKGSRLAVQIYPSGEGGVEIFATKLNENTGRLPSSISSVADFDILLCCDGLYHFSTLSDMKRALLCVRDLSVLFVARVFSCRSGYILSFTARGRASDGGSVCELLPLFEFGEQLPNTAFLHVLEHYTEISADLL